MIQTFPRLLLIATAGLLTTGAMSCSPLRAPAALADEGKMTKDDRRLSPGAARTEGRPRWSEPSEAAPAEMAEGSPIFLDYSFGDDPQAPTALNAPLEEGEAEADLFLPENSHPELVNGPALLPSWTVPPRSTSTLGLPETITSQPEGPELPRRQDRLDPDVVRAWAAAVAPLTGVSRTEPLVTVAMVATPDISADATSAAVLARDVLSLASAFAGQQKQQLAPTPSTPQPLE
jgi:hypothetical protein